MPLSRTSFIAFTDGVQVHLEYHVALITAVWDNVSLGIHRFAVKRR
jgi:hypothetical protein